jgi:BirA family transcriptional regulator, biotin operon repressor / biotin---[acetyl-CoA-carboxylase] ligase
VSTGAEGVAPLGFPRLHLRVTDSTNTRGRELAAAGAPHGTLVTAGEQSAGRGRQGRIWSAPAGRALLCSLVIRDPRQLLSLCAGVAVAEVAEVARTGSAAAGLKWPNDVLIDGRKVAGILVEGRPQERWAVLGVGLNVALREADFPAELGARAGTLGLEPAAIEPVLARLLASLQRWLAAPATAVLDAVRERDALRGHRVGWSEGEGRAAGIDARGRLLVDTADGRRLALEAGEVHLVAENRA